MKSLKSKIINKIPSAKIEDESKNALVLEKNLDSNLQNVKIQKGLKDEEYFQSSPISLSENKVLLESNLELLNQISWPNNNSYFDGATWEASTLTFNTTNFHIASGELSLTAGVKLQFDGEGAKQTYITEASADVLDIAVGGDIMLKLHESGIYGNWADFGSTSVGFNQFDATYDSSDTNVNFRNSGNKGQVTLTGNVTDMNLYFPDVSCNCVLLITQDGTGSRTVSNWKTFDQASGNESTVKWAGGSAPTLTTTASKVDIVSFYWDNDNHKAYGVASLNF